MHAAVTVDIDFLYRTLKPGQGMRAWQIGRFQSLVCNLYNLCLY